MRRTAARALAVVTLLPILTFAVLPPAAADRGNFYVADQFPLGQALLSLVFADAGRYGYGGREYGAPPFYYRSRQALPAYGQQCSRHCFVDQGYRYHHPSCRVLQSSFYNNRAHPSSFWPANYPNPDWSAYGWRDLGRRYLRDPYDDRGYYDDRYYRDRVLDRRGVFSPQDVRRRNPRQTRPNRLPNRLPDPYGVYRGDRFGDDDDDDDDDDRDIFGRDIYGRDRDRGDDDDD